MSNWQTFDHSSELDQQLAGHIADLLATDIKSKGSASLAVSGGNTPKGVFAQLAQCDIDWSRVTVTLVDDRWVNSDHSDSNERLVREHLLQGRAAGAQLLSLKSQHATPDEGLAEIEDRIGAINTPFSAVVLGMGGDGHTASWFPQASNLAQLLDPTGSALVGATDPVSAPHLRITLTFPAVLNSRAIIVHITGAQKRTVLEDARVQHYPIAAILEQTTTPVTVWWAAS